MERVRYSRTRATRARDPRPPRAVPARRLTPLPLLPPPLAGPSIADDLRELETAGLNERFAPELLPHRDELVRRVRAAVDAQQEVIADLSQEDALLRMIYDTELERTQYLLRTYLRTRILKIQQQALHLARDPDAQALLADSEAAFAEKYASMYQEHVDREAWSLVDTSRLPETLKTITSIKQLVSPPEVGVHVFCKATRDVEPFNIDGTTDMVDLEKDTVALLPYAPLRPFIEKGWVELK